MKAKDISAHQLAKATNVGYEAIRSVVAGDRPPGNLLFGAICRVLDLNPATTGEMLIAEQMKRKFGKIPTLVKNPELQRIDELWPFLLPEEKEHVTWLVGHFAEKRTRKREQPMSPQRIAPRPVRTP
jgi:hypothetical protein